MNKADLVAKISAAAGTSKKDAEKVLNAFMDEVGAALKKGDKVQLVGFGTFEAKTRAERKGRNPQTGKEMVIPASTIPVFKAGSGLKDKVK